MNIKSLMAMLAGATLMGNVALAQGNYNYTFTTNANSGVVPDGNLSGLALSETLSGISGAISNLTLSLNISGGYNGDLYAYLAGPNGGFTVLFNRVGATNGGSAFGYSDSGMNVTFSDSAADNFHYYQNVPSYSLTGTLWQPDGRNIDPMSDPNLFGSTSPSTPFSSFAGTDANGIWTLFLADLSAGGQSTVVSWSLDITTVPEPPTVALAGIGLAGALLLMRRRTQRN